MKKLSVISVIIIMALMLLGFGGCERATVSDKVEKYGEYPDGNYYIQVKDPTGFKILFFADTQMMYDDLSTGSPSEKTLRLVDTLIQTETPDLVAFAGDLTNKAWEPSKSQEFLLSALGERVERHNVLWTLVWGNHDAEATDAESAKYSGREVSKAQISETLKSKFKRLLLGGVREGVDGVGNFYINILGENDVIAKTIYNLDTVRPDISHSDSEYGGFKSSTAYRNMTMSQAEWFGVSCQENKTRNFGSSPECFVLAHTMTNSGYTAYERGSVSYGERLEGKASVGEDYTAFKKLEKYMKEYNCVGYFAGHQHRNDYSAVFEGIRYTFVQHSGYCNYYKTHKSADYKCTRGGTLVTLNGYNGFKCEQALISQKVEGYDWDKDVEFKYNSLFN